MKDYVSCIMCRTVYETNLEQCPKCRTNSYTYNKSSNSEIEISEEEVDSVFKILVNHRRRKILRFLPRYAEKSRREIADYLDISLEATTKHCNKLVNMGLISEIGRKDSENGKRKRYLSKYIRNADTGLRLDKIFTIFTKEILGNEY